MTTRLAKVMLSTRLPTYQYDRLQAYKAASRFTIEEIISVALDEHLDKHAQYQTPAISDARIDALEAKLDMLFKERTPRNDT